MTFFFKVASINYFSVMNKLYLFLIAFYISSCTANETLVDKVQTELQIISFDVVQKKLIIEEEVPVHLEKLINHWFNEKVKINGFDGDMTFIITDFNQVITLINDGKRVDASMSFKVKLNKPTLSSKKIIEGKVSSYGVLEGDFSLSDFDNVIQNTQSDLIIRLSRDLKSNTKI